VLIDLCYANAICHSVNINEYDGDHDVPHASQS